MYLRAKVKPVSFRSTMRTFPNAPFPTTRRSRKWLRLTVERVCKHTCNYGGSSVRRSSGVSKADRMNDGEDWKLTFVSEDNGLAIGIAHRSWSKCWKRMGKI